jgi:hypothetical protein
MYHTESAEFLEQDDVKFAYLFPGLRFLRRSMRDNEINAPIEGHEDCHMAMIAFLKECSQKFLDSLSQIPRHWTNFQFRAIPFRTEKKLSTKNLR